MRFFKRRPDPIDRDDAAAFLEFAKAVLPSSYSQRFQDLFGLWEAGFARDGYFVEFGALNGRDFSNSFLMEKVGWQGVVAEPHPDYERQIRKHRSCYVSTKCVFDTTGDTVTFHAVKGRPALSTIGGFGTTDPRAQLRETFVEHQVETITLTDLLDEAGAPQVIDFLSIDTEGSEPQILRAFDFDRYPIRAISVEHNDHQRDELYELLTGKGYRRKWPEISGHDDWYVHTDLELGPRDPRERDALVSAAAEVEPFDRDLELRSELLGSLRG